MVCISELVLSGLELSVDRLLAAGIPQGLLAMRTAELQQQQQQWGGGLFLWGRRKDKQPRSLVLSADDEFTKAILRLL